MARELKSWGGRDKERAAKADGCSARIRYVYGRRVGHTELATAHETHDAGNGDQRFRFHHFRSWKLVAIRGSGAESIRDAHKAQNKEKDADA